MNWAKLKDDVEEKNRICATQTNLLLMETFSAKVGLFVSRKKQGEQKKRKKIFSLFSHLFLSFVLSHYIQKEFRTKGSYVS